MDEQLKRDLLMMDAWAKHWKDDFAAGLKPTKESLADARERFTRIMAAI